MQTIEQPQTGVLTFQPENILNFNKATIAEKANAAVMPVKDGFVDPVKALILVKKNLEFYGQLEKQIRPIAEGSHTITKAQPFKGFETEVTEKETGVEYDYTACNDPEWIRLNKAMADAKTELTAREKFLKTLTKKLVEVNEETGEVTEIHPPIRKSKLGLNVTIK